MTRHLLAPHDVNAAFYYVAHEGSLYVFADDLRSAAGIPWEYYRLDLECTVYPVRGTVVFQRGAHHVSSLRPDAGAEAAHAMKGVMWELGDVGVYACAMAGAHLGRISLIEHEPLAGGWWLSWTSSNGLTPDALHRWLLDHLIPR